MFQVRCEVLSYGMVYNSYNSFIRHVQSFSFRKWGYWGRDKSTEKPPELRLDPWQAWLYSTYLHDTTHFPVPVSWAVIRFCVSSTPTCKRLATYFTRWILVRLLATRASTHLRDQMETQGSCGIGQNKHLGLLPLQVRICYLSGKSEKWLQCCNTLFLFESWTLHGLGTLK